MDTSTCRGSRRDDGCVGHYGAIVGGIGATTTNYDGWYGDTCVMACHGHEPWLDVDDDIAINDGALASALDASSCSLSLVHHSFKGKFLWVWVHTHIGGSLVVWVGGKKEPPF